MNLAYMIWAAMLLSHRPSCRHPLQAQMTVLSVVWDSPILPEPRLSGYVSHKPSDCGQESGRCAKLYSLPTLCQGKTIFSSVSILVIKHHKGNEFCRIREFHYFCNMMSLCLWCFKPTSTHSIHKDR